MEKYLITKKSQNRITGPIMVTTSPRKTCPIACPLRKTAEGASAGGCYAEHGFLGGFIWSNLDRLPVGGAFQKGQIKVHGFGALLNAIRALPDGAIWRHNQAGDLPSKDAQNIDADKLEQLVAANTDKRGFTYTHYDVVDNQSNADAVKSANDYGFTINLSANSIEHADKLYDLGIAPVTTIVPADATDNMQTPKGRPVVICPARRFDNVTCKTCGICAKQRKAIIGFPALGKAADQII